MELILAGDQLRGKFWFQGNYTSCCDGPDADDGTAIFLIDGESITELRLSQRVDDFNGGPCNGSYEGTGTVENFNSLVIDFTGDDCDGFHDGSFTLTRDPTQ